MGISAGRVRGSCVLHWGASSVSNTVVTRFLFPGYENGIAQGSLSPYRMPRPGVLRNFFVRHNAPAGNGLDVVYTVRLNGIVTALTVALASTGSDGSDLVSRVVVALGDLIDIRVTKAADIVTSPAQVLASLELI